jgi:CBS domain containing-hemolysin-like protein
MQQVVFVVEHTKISDLLRKLQAKKTHMAVVLDEYGGTLGIATVEDIIEELVGEIYDEHDEESELIKENQDGSLIVNCSTVLYDFFEKVGFEEDDDEFDANTVGGWVAEVLGEIPTTGKKFTYKNLEVKVSKSTRKKALEIKVKMLSNEEIESLIESD